MTRSTIAVIFCVALLSAATQAHVIVTPRESAAGAEQVYTVRVPVEGTVASTSVELEIPAGLHVMQVAEGAGFTFDVKRENNRIVSITWTKEIKPKEPAALFTFTAHNPPSGTLQWKAHQTFADGSVRHWVAERGARTADGKPADPASVTTIVAKGSKPAAPADQEHHDHKP